MDADRYARTIAMRCSTCGGTDFEYDADLPDGPIRCVGCDRIFDRQELIDENGATIEAHVDEVKSEIMGDVRKNFRDAFKGNKYIKIK